MNGNTNWWRVGTLGVGFLGMLGSLFAEEEPWVVNDPEIMSSISEDIGKFVDNGKATSGKILMEQCERTHHKNTFKLPQAASDHQENLYRSCADSVVVIDSVYKCKKCTDWHSAGPATAWVLTSDGVMVTNYHVFELKDMVGYGIRTRDGKVAPVVEIIAASKKHDVALFRVEGSGFKPLPLGPPAAVGSDVHIIAHPDRRFYTYTSGKVSRYYRKYGKSEPGLNFMAVTAEFARGSSGGPVMDSAGNVVGMIASTSNIYYPSKEKKTKDGPLQMVIRNCVPVSAIRALIENSKK